MNSAQYGYHHYPSPSQAQAQAPQQLSPQLQQQQQQHTPDLTSPSHQPQQQQQLSPQQSPTSPHQQQSPEQQHSSHISLDHALSPTNSINNSSNNTNNHIEHPSPSHSNDAQSPVHGDNDPHILSNAGVPSSNALQSPQGHPTSLLPMPSPALAAATAANTSANSNPTGNRQMIIQQYQNQQQQQHQQQHQQHQLGMGGMSMPMQSSGSGGGNPGTINTAMMSLQGPSAYLLPSPQSAGASGQPPLPILPPQSPDLDTILAKFANQPDLLKLIIASKTEEDRRWAEEARYRMMDLIMRGENRGLGFMVGYEALGGIPGNMPGMMGMTAKRFMEEGGGSGGGYGQHGMFGGFSTPGANPGNPGTQGAGGQGQGTSAQGSAGILAMGGSSSAAGTSSAGLPSLYAQTQMPNPFGMGMGGITHGTQSMMGQTMGGNPSGFGQYMDPSLARKRSVTFAGEVHHMRSQSLSSITPNSVGQLGGMSSMLGSMNSSDGFGQQQQQHPHQQTSGLQNPQQYQYQGQQQHQQSMHYHQSSPPPPPQFASNNPYSHQSFGSQNTLPSLHHHGAIRRTNSLSHIGQAQTTVTEQRLVAGRPRNESSASMRTMDDDSDEDSEDDYENHPVTGMGMSSRPGSALSMHNNVGGNGETSLTLEFSDMASVSGNSGSQHDHSGSTTTTTTTKGHHRTSSSISSMGGVQDSGAGSEYKRKRKRREMQPVNKIVDSPEPHIDPYLWKNNGNTTQKKTGCKSIYYKCSNSPAGCTVNKTVTEKEGGGYLTKYRGEHLEDCIRLKKAQQAAQAAQAAAAQNGHHHHHHPQGHMSIKEQ
ncbi:hypothetical protein K457DRAFT_138239 [Linnemannia elongata AG-77]|uniref:WRKY domain-containing protein n=1 Tax=Linnemannia elongata AG-77 TaxID=1314771 RepID=A0A197JUQ8_9FUNG|nr:hypothetical protein K457DRAFT_138239 [Linnemannia elongata AG-77]